jgi:hypothetical protein
MTWHKKIFSNILKWMNMDCPHASTPCFYFLEWEALLSVPSALNILSFIHRWKVLIAVPPLHEPPGSIEIMGKCNNWGGAGRTSLQLYAGHFSFWDGFHWEGPTPRLFQWYTAPTDILNWGHLGYFLDSEPHRPFVTESPGPKLQEMEVPAVEVLRILKNKRFRGASFKSDRRVNLLFWIHWIKPPELNPAN